MTAKSDRNPFKSTGSSFLFALVLLLFLACNSNGRQPDPSGTPASTSLKGAGETVPSSPSVPAGGEALGSRSPEQRTGNAPPARRALLIGINKYQKVPDLYGSTNDVAMIKRVLMSKFGFQERHIKTLEDEKATRAGILSSLRKFVKETNPKDIVYIHYSGHGSQVEDLDGDEKVQDDSTLR